MKVGYIRNKQAKANKILFFSPTQTNQEETKNNNCTLISFALKNSEILGKSED